MATNQKKNTIIPLKGRAAQWEWEGDRSVWQQYSLDVQEELTRAFDQGLTEVRVQQTEELSVIVNFAEMIQKNDTNESTRRIRLALELKDKNGFSFYEYQNEKKKWVIYKAAIMLQIAQALDDDETEVTVTDDLESYEIDLDRLTEKHLQTDRVRKIHCIRSMAKLPLNSSTMMNKRLFDHDDPEENTKKRRSVSSKSVPMEKSAMRTIKTVVGKVPVDAECVKMIDKAHVYCENDDVFDCMLNQTNVGNNNNKFYLIQLLEKNQDKHYYVWLRWGRVGYNGQNNLMDFRTDLDEAKRFFCQKFADKTKNDFYFRHEFIKYPGKYDFVQLDYNPSNVKKRDENDENESKSLIKKEMVYTESQLDPRVQDLIRLICNVQAMEEALLEMKFDARKNPLGKLSANQIKAGYQALKEIETFIKKHQFNAAFIEANNTYYTRIPHEFGRMTPPLIKTIPQLKHEIELLEALDEIEVVLSDLNTDDTSRRHPIDQQYERLKCRLSPINKDDEIYHLIEKYLHSTHASTHQQYQMEIEDIFEVDKEHEKEVFNDVGNKMLLWHGSRLTNYAGILSQGLRIAPPEAPVTGYMFGKGIYFADMSSKSANYCYPTPRKNIGLVLLSEVALGKSNELLHADNHANRLPEGLSSVKGLGSTAPDPKNAVKIENDVTIPMGPAESTDVVNPKGYTLNYNEYIVYDTKQVRMRYLIKLKFIFK